MLIACKLPHGLTVNHNGQTININGTNATFDPMNPMANGAVLDNEIIAAGFGLTTIEGAQAEAFADWAAKAVYRDGVKENGQLDEPFLPLVNGQLSVFKNEADARKEVKTMTSVPSGMDGLDGDAEIKKLAESTDSQLVNSGKAK